MNPTEAQLRIYDFVEHGTGNGIIDAVAGAGKTTTLMGCVSHIPNINDVIYCAFNTSIRKELQKKFKDANQNVKVSTIHALGFQMLRATKNFRLDDYKYNHIIKEPQFFDTLIPDIDKILGYHSHPTVAELRQLEKRRDIPGISVMRWFGPTIRMRDWVLTIPQYIWSVSSVTCC